MGKKKYIYLLLSIQSLFIVIAASVNIYVDPFHVFDYFSYKKNEEISLRSNYRLYKLSKYIKKPVANIILGDSRMEALSTEDIIKVSGKNYFNLAFGGASLTEIINSFWFASEKIKLKKVYVGLNLNIYNSSYLMDQVSEANKIINNKASYLLSPFVSKISFYQFMYNYNGSIFISESPKKDKDTFWDEQLGISTKTYYEKYAYPNRNIKKLKEIIKYCKSNHIKLTFVVPPTHVDLQKKLDEYNLRAAENNFKNDIKSMSTVIDFDFPNVYTKNRTMFTDPYHAGEELRQLMISELWGLNPKRRISRKKEGFYE